MNFTKQKLYNKTENHIFKKNRKNPVLLELDHKINNFSKFKTPNKSIKSFIKLTKHKSEIKLRKIDKFLSLNTIMFFTGLIFALLLFFLMLAAFLSGWFYLIIKSIDNKEDTDPSMLIMDFPAGVGEYMLPVIGMIIVFLFVKKKGDEKESNCVQPGNSKSF